VPSQLNKAVSLKENHLARTSECILHIWCPSVSLTTILEMSLLTALRSSKQTQAWAAIISKDQKVTALYINQSFQGYMAFNGAKCLKSSFLNLVTNVLMWYFFVPPLLVFYRHVVMFFFASALMHNWWDYISNRCSCELSTSWRKWLIHLLLFWWFWLVGQAPEENHNHWSLFPTTLCNDSCIKSNDWLSLKKEEIRSHSGMIIFNLYPW